MQVRPYQDTVTIDHKSRWWLDRLFEGIHPPLSDSQVSLSYGHRDGSKSRDIAENIDITTRLNNGSTCGFRNANGTFAKGTWFATKVIYQVPEISAPTGMEQSRKTAPRTPCLIQCNAQLLSGTLDTIIESMDVTTIAPECMRLPSTRPTQTQHVSFYAADSMYFL